MAMENAEYETVTISSFSQSWLINSLAYETTGGCSVRSSVDGAPSSFIEIDPRSPVSNFQFPDSKSPVHLVHAEDVFRNGQFLPRASSVLINASGAGAGASRDLPLTGSSSKLSSMKRGKNVLSKSVLNKYLSCLRPLLTCGRGGVSSKVAENCVPSLQETVPRTSVASYCVDGHWRRSSGSDGSIDEAVLHCKRSIST